MIFIETLKFYLFMFSVVVVCSLTYEVTNKRDSELSSTFKNLLCFDFILRPVAYILLKSVLRK